MHRTRIEGVVCPNCGSKLVYKCMPTTSPDYYSCEACHYITKYIWDLPGLQIFETIQNLLVECRQILEKHGEKQIINRIDKILEKENKHE